ncbi:hypothetical protein F2P81_026075 [Scophthalmus maximus]|uniref:Uncharacterized protein n=1 Tax=Scophthalmus maximus TaxID=52904 RepID=A0A6A4RRL8_SCOMX|nr:hypothetical protein F2P81_026075 [Scophthalmus maximus]
MSSERLWAYFILNFEDEKNARYVTLSTENKVSVSSGAVVSEAAQGTAGRPQQVQSALHRTRRQLQPDVWSPDKGGIKLKEQRRVDYVIINSAHCALDGYSHESLKLNLVASLQPEYS